MKRASQTLMQTKVGACHYTLLREDDLYTIVAEDPTDRITLDRFTDNEALADVIFTMLTEHAVSPLQIQDIWEDLYF